MDNHTELSDTCVCAPRFQGKVLCLVTRGINLMACSCTAYPTLLYGRRSTPPSISGTFPLSPTISKTEQRMPSSSLFHLGSSHLPPFRTLCHIYMSQQKRHVRVEPSANLDLQDCKAKYVFPSFIPCSLTAYVHGTRTD